MITLSSVPDRVAAALPPGLSPLRLIAADGSADDADEMLNLRDHAANRGRVLALDHLLHAAESEATNRLAHIAGAADEAAHPFDLQRA